MKEKDRIIFYSDEVNDDFGKKHVRDDAYKGKKKVIIERHGLYDKISFVFICFVHFLINIYKFFGGVKVIGKKNVKKLPKDQGFFIYANHAGIIDVALSYFVSWPKRSQAVGYTDALANPVTHFLVPLCGFIPLPTDIHDMPKLNKAIRYYVEERKQGVIIFPEAHLWPTYIGVRNFKRQSFHYPVEFDKPVLPVFFARRERKGFWKLFRKPRITIIIGEPLYPDKSLERRDAIQKLGDETYESLVKLSKSIPQEEYWKYVYREKK